MTSSVSGGNFLFDSFDSILNQNRSFSNIFFNSSCCERIQIILSVVLLISCILIFILYTIFPLVKSLFKVEQKRSLLSRGLKGWAVTTIFSGWLVYTIGFCEKGTSSSFWALVIRPILSSLEQFVFHSDLLEVSEACHTSSWFMTIYSITYLSAVLISSVVVVNCLGNRFYFLFKRIWWSLVGCKTLNVFFGINIQGINLANSLSQEKYKKQSTEKNKRNRILFVSFPDESGEVHRHSSLSKLFGINTYVQEKASFIRKIGGTIINANSYLFDDNLPDVLTSQYALELNGLGKLIKILKHSDKIRLFFLSENESENIRAGINIERSHAIKDKKVYIYCRARQSYENYTWVDNSSNAIFHLVDDSSFAINSLMLLDKDKSGDPISHPINYVKINNTLGVVESKFSCLIVGFGQTGQDALKFFYEYGAFVGKDGKKSPFYCRVVDKDMNNLLGYVAREIPALQHEDDAQDKPITKQEVEFFNYDATSVDFWDSLEKVVSFDENNNPVTFIKEVNCIVVAIGSDEENIALAAQLYEFAMRNDAIKNDNGEILKIFVRSYDPAEEFRLKKVEDYYRDENDVIRVFGKMSEIYSYDVIIGNQLQAEAKIFYRSYNSVLGYQDDWDERHNKLRNGTMSDRIDTRLKEKQDRSNVLHKYTKLQLLGLPSIKSRHLPVDYPFITETDLKEIANNSYKYKNEEDKDMMLWYTRLQNVSKCEHLRWCASLYMHGFIRDGNQKDYRLRQHKCLVEWDDKELDSNGVEHELLDDKTKMYDYKVVETTILLNQEKETVVDNK